MKIDKERKRTPARSVKQKKKFKLIYSDHFSVVISFKDLPRKREDRKEKKVMWNLAKTNGWEEYKQLTNKYSDKLDKVLEDDTVTTMKAFEKIEKILNSIKYEAFGKVTIDSSKLGEVRKHIEVDHDNKESDAEYIYKEQEKKVEEELEKLKSCKNGKAGKVWQIRKNVIGVKKSKMVPTAIIDPSTGKMIKNKNYIKEITLKYCIDTLANNHPAKGFEELIETKKKKVAMLMELTDGSFETNFETFKYNINKFKVKGKKNYNFLTKAGEKFQNIVYKMCRQMFEVEQFPDSFSETTLHMLWKGKGRPEML